MTRDEAFLDAILAAPEEDAARLTYSDFLEENGDPERAEFIRLECRLEGLLARSPNRYPLEFRARKLLCITDGVFRYEGNLSAELEARERELVAAHGARWAAPVARLVDYLGFRHGFVAEVGMSGRAFLGDAPALFRAAPIRHVSFSRVPPGVAPILMGSPSLARLRSLGLDHNRIGPKGGRCLAECPYLGGLAALSLVHCRIGDEAFRALSASPLTTGLKCLDLWNNDLTEASARLLAEAPSWAGLEHLSLGCNDLGEEGKRLLREKFADRVTFGLYGSAPA